MKAKVGNVGTKNQRYYPQIVNVVARSETGRGGERAWVSLVTERRDFVLIADFKGEDFGEKAWPRAVKYGKQLAERLGVAFRKKRDPQSV